MERKDRPISENRQKLIDEKNKSSLIVGETVMVLVKAVSLYSKDKDSTKSCNCTIESLTDGIVVFVGNARDRKKHTVLHKITEEDIVGRNLLNIGANPFEENVGDIRPVAFTMESILFNLDIFGDKREMTDPYAIEGVIVSEVNWNPFIYSNDRKKEYYQRPLVWTENDKQLLIESIYQNIDCGKILVRKRGFEELKKMQSEGETELSFNDIVDGKQRLNAIKCFMKGEFKDLQGNYYSDLSSYSQYKFTNHQLLSYAEMPENTKDEDVIKQFLKLNFTGVPQSKEHIDFVKSLKKLPI